MGKVYLSPMTDWFDGMVLSWYNSVLTTIVNFVAASSAYIRYPTTGMEINMAKVLLLRSATADDPIYSGGVETFSRRGFAQSLSTSPTATNGATQEASQASSLAPTKSQPKTTGSPKAAKL